MQLLLYTVTIFIFLSLKGTPVSAASGQKRHAAQNLGGLCAPKKSNNSSEGTQKGAADVLKYFHCVFVSVWCDCTYIL